MLEYVAVALVIFGFILGGVLGLRENGGFPRSRAEYTALGLVLLAFIIGGILGLLLP
jgi:hypothetical protein